MSTVRDRQNINTELRKEHVKKGVYFRDGRELFHSIVLH